MRNLLLSLLMLFLSVNFTFSQIETIDDNRELNDIKGPIKSCTITYFEAQDYFGDLKKIKENGYQIFEFDSIGRVRHYEDYDHNDDWVIDIKYRTKDNTVELIGTDAGKKILGQYKLNSSNQVIEHLYFVNDTLAKKELAKFNAKDSLIEYRRYQKNGSLAVMRIFEFDSSNRLIHSKNVFNSSQSEQRIEYLTGLLIKSKKIYDPSGKLTQIWFYKYDEKKRIVQTIMKDAQNKNYQNKTTYNYDSIGNLLTESEFRMYDGKTFIPFRITEFKYDNQKRLIEKNEKAYLHSIGEEWYSSHRESFIYNQDQNIASQEVYSYYPNMKSLSYKSLTLFEYDDNGNWIKKIQTNTNDLSQPFETLEKSVTERNIIYYN